MESFQIEEIEALAVMEAGAEMDLSVNSNSKPDVANNRPSDEIDSNEINITQDITPSLTEDTANGDDLDEDSDEDIVVTIGEIKSTVPTVYQKPATGGALGKIDLDSNPVHKGTPIYDLDLAMMEEKPWRKAGADITDYFNYGFNEDTWNMYCERQKKLRSEFGDKGQDLINKSLFSSIQLPSSSISLPQQSISQSHHFTTSTGGRQLVVIGEGEPALKSENRVQKIVVDLTRPPPQHIGTNPSNPVPILRTVIGMTGAVVSTQNLNFVPTSGAHGDNNSNCQNFSIKNDSTQINVTDSHTNSPSIGQNLPTDVSQKLASTTIPVIGTNQRSLSSLPASQSVVLPQQDFSKPPPIFETRPPPSISILNSNSSQSSGNQTLQSHTPISASQQSQLSQTTSKISSVKSEMSDLPPGVDEPEPPGISSSSPPTSNTGIRLGVGNPLGVQFPVAGSAFNPSVPPPLITAQIPASSLNLQNSSIYQQPPQQFSGQFGIGGSQFGGYPRLFNPMGGGHPFRRERPSYRSSFASEFGHRRFDRDRDSSESDNEKDYRRKRRRRMSRSRSRSPLDTRSRKSDEKDYQRGSRDKESSRKSRDSKEKEHKRSSRGDRERSADELSHKKKIKKEKIDDE